ncbi:lipid-A-disaccharide synthase [Arsenicitalea aurantiaca]|uniref:Lipid-A-disaccharide synthase n=1 Tax=Arsenicitalea aurantiaca TaxID=1783274 RepID=A0A433XF88_9HYPH|nr:lipid-A-disaccharide synthase [Arsenicitalea aurantiaca]RUT32732.1 lipid-A-disaccharide synthase [Arsenicitalea aurantiaca]
MPERADLFVVAGEPSGDRLGAALIADLRARRNLDIMGVGGDGMIGQGLDTLFPLAELSVMGVSDVVLRLPNLLRRLGQLARLIRRIRPRVVVLIDNKLFSTLLAKRLRKAGYRGAILLYVAPTVWARKPERAAQIRPLFDEVLAILPFEPEVMVRLGGPPTHYVGHPALARAASELDLETARYVALLPGSRAGELKRHLPLFAELAGRLAQRPERLLFYIPTLPHLAPNLGAAVSSWPVPVAIVTDPEERRRLESETRVAIACAGTATLELALAGVPMVITYVMDGIQSRHFERLGRPWVGLPNIVLESDVTPECVLAQADVGPVLAAAQDLLDRPSSAHAQQAAFRRLRQMMEEGRPGTPRESAADRVLMHLKDADSLS